VHYWADLQSVHGLRCYGYITRNVSEYMLALALCLVITSSRSSLTSGRIAAARGRFNDISQMAQVCTHTSYMDPWANTSPNPKRHLHLFSRLCTARRRVFLHFTTGCPFLPPSKLPDPMEDQDPIMVPCAHSSPQPKRHLDRLNRFCRVYYCERQIDRPTNHAILGR